MREVIHHHHSDANFCGSQQTPRRFAVDVKDVTCEACLFGNSQDRMYLSAEGRRYLAALDAAAALESTEECARCGDLVTLQRCEECGDSLCTTCYAFPCAPVTEGRDPGGEA